nr:hypothetical protein [Tanacetum cinerariifolium]
MQKKFSLGISRMKEFRAKSQASSRIRGDYQLQYSLLRDYVLELKKCNLHTTVKIEVQPPTDAESNTGIFKRIYVCIDALKLGFKASLRDILGLDGAFMKGPFSRQVLTTVNIDGNNGIYPLAYAIVEAETTNSWTLFLEYLGSNLELGMMSNFTFVTDRQKCVVDMGRRICSCRKWEFIGLPCKHVVASLWNMAQNGMEVGILED